MPRKSTNQNLAGNQNDVVNGFDDSDGDFENGGTDEEDVKMPSPMGATPLVRTRKRKRGKSREPSKAAESPDITQRRTKRRKNVNDDPGVKVDEAMIDWEQGENKRKKSVDDAALKIASVEHGLATVSIDQPVLPSNGNGSTPTAGGIPLHQATMTSHSSETKKLAPLEKLRPPSQHTPGVQMETPKITLDRIPNAGQRLVFDAEPPRVTLDSTLPVAKKSEVDRHNIDNRYPNGEMQSPSSIPAGSEQPIIQEVESSHVIQSILRRNWIWFLFMVGVHSIGASIFPSVTDSSKIVSYAYGVSKPLSGVPTPVGVQLEKKVAKKTKKTIKRNKTITMEEVEIPESLVEGLQKLDSLNKAYLTAVGTARKDHDRLFGTLVSLERTLKSRETQLTKQQEELAIAQVGLKRALEDDDFSSEVWQAARNAVKVKGQGLLDVTTVDLWQVDEPLVCSTNMVESNVSLPVDLVTTEILEKQVEDLKAMATITATRLIRSRESSSKVQGWVKERIEKELRGNPAVERAINEPPKSVGGGLNFDQVNFAIQERLEIERADRTGQVDYASLYLGAEVISGGRRGTTRSLIDSLPIFNRIMQLTELRFYGHGPEVALTPTYPPGALGQCWSLTQTPIEEQLKRRRYSSASDDDHKRGNFGTLTVSLPVPVHVDSVVIEHPPKSSKYQPTSAIRSFRIIGYTDAKATSKSHSLGSFEYDIQHDDSMQEFEVATDIFGTPVPPLHSITLAIDSNWGNDYACLYRFRVHGEPAEED